MRPVSFMIIAQPPVGFNSAPPERLRLLPQNLHFSTVFACFLRAFTAILPVSFFLIGSFPVFFFQKMRETVDKMPSGAL